MIGLSRIGIGRIGIGTRKGAQIEKLKE